MNRDDYGAWSTLTARPQPTVAATSSVTHRRQIMGRVRGAVQAVIDWFTEY